MMPHPGSGRPRWFHKEYALAKCLFHSVPTILLISKSTWVLHRPFCRFPLRIMTFKAQKHLKHDSSSHNVLWKRCEGVSVAFVSSAVTINISSIPALMQYKCKRRQEINAIFVMQKWVCVVHVRTKFWATTDSCTFSVTILLLPLHPDPMSWDTPRSLLWPRPS